MLSVLGYSSGMSEVVSGNWRRLADYVRSARVQKGLSSQALLAEAAGVSEGSVRSLESGKSYTRMPVVVPAIERALGWPPGTARRLVEGGDADMPFALPQDLSLEDERIYRELLESARTLSKAEKRRLLVDLFDEPGPTAE